MEKLVIFIEFKFEGKKKYIKFRWLLSIIKKKGGNVGEEETKVTLQIYTRFLYNVKNSSLEGPFFLQLKNFPFSCIEIRRFFFFFFQRWKSPKDRESLIICMYKYDFPPSSFRFD